MVQPIGTCPLTPAVFFTLFALLQRNHEAFAGNQVEFAFRPPDITVRYQGYLESANQIRGTMAIEVQLRGLSDYPPPARF